MLLTLFAFMVVAAAAVASHRWKPAQVKAVAAWVLAPFASAGSNEVARAQTVGDRMLAAHVGTTRGGARVAPAGIAYVVPVELFGLFNSLRVQLRNEHIGHLKEKLQVTAIPSFDVVVYRGSARSAVTVEVWRPGEVPPRAPAVDPAAELDVPTDATISPPGSAQPREDTAALRSAEPTVENPAPLRSLEPTSLDPAAPTEAPWGELVDDTTGVVFALTGPTVTFGRHPDNDVVLPDPSVSRHHGVLRRDGATIENRSTTNGILVDGDIPLLVGGDQAEIVDGSTLTLSGSYTLRFRALAGVAR